MRTALCYSALLCSALLCSALLCSALRYAALLSQLRLARNLGCVCSGPVVNTSTHESAQLVHESTGLEATQLVDS